VYGGVNRIDAATAEHTRIANDLGVPMVIVDTRERRKTKAVLALKRERLLVQEPAMLDYIEQATKLVDALEAELTSAPVDYDCVGEIMTCGHGLLRNLVGCSTDLLDKCVERVVTAGAYGAKLTGSGHGGCLVALVAEDVLDQVLEALSDLPVHSVALPTSERRGLVTEGTFQ
jgi:mevalonate kinase